MENFCCTKCGSVNVFIEVRWNQKALMCSDCQSWIKWISKKQLPFVEKFINENKQNKWGDVEVEEETHKPDLYDFMSMTKDILVQFDDEELDVVATNLKGVIDELINSEKLAAKRGIRVRKTFDEIVFGSESHE